MDPIDFIDSKDVREYLRKIGYECEPVEASYLIWRSYGRTLKEKHEACENDLDVLYQSFRGMRFDIPTPFKIGDIVRDCLGGDPTVIDHIPTGRVRNWNASIDVYSFDHNVYGLTTDLLYEMVDEKPCEDDLVFKLRAEYYREELMGKDRALAAYSSYLNNELSYSEFLRYTHAFSCEYTPLEEGCIPSKIKILISGDAVDHGKGAGINDQK